MAHRFLLSLFTAALLGVFLQPAMADEQNTQTETVTEEKKPPSVSGLPIPRFVTLGTGQARMRRGPGVQYPVDWIYKRRGLPLEVIAEFELWRKVRDVDGAEGWMHKSLLSGRRLVRIVGKKQPFRERPEEGAPITFYAEGGVLGVLERCDQDYCRVNIEKMTGWARKEHLWGVYSKEIID